MNDNCLEGMKCPNCGSEGPFRINGTACFIVHDDGTDEYNEVEWQDNDFCGCVNCNYDGKVIDFCVSEQQRKDMIDAYAQACVDSMDMDTLMDTAKEKIEDNCAGLDIYETAEDFREWHPEAFKSLYPCWVDRKETPENYEAEIEHVLVCSTAHMFNSDHIKKIMSMDAVTAFDTEYGVIIVIPSILKPDNEDREEESELRINIGDNIVNILKYAAEKGCWAVNFDCDCDALPFFATYDW